MKVKANTLTEDQIEVENCVFQGNTGNSQGAIYHDSSVYELGYGVKFEKCTFSQNYGAMGLVSMTQTLNHIVINNSYFFENNGL
jgi:hypothetical protein